MPSRKVETPTPIEPLEHITLEDYERAAHASASAPVSDDAVRALGWEPTPQGWLPLVKQPDGKERTRDFPSDVPQGGEQTRLDPYRDPEDTTASWALGTPLPPPIPTISAAEAERELRISEGTRRQVEKLLGRPMEEEEQERHPDRARPRERRAPRPPRPPRA